MGNGRLLAAGAATLLLLLCIYFVNSPTSSGSSTEPAVVSAADDTQARLDAFHAWLQERGANLSAVSIVAGSPMQGFIMRTRKHVPAGELLWSLPASLPITLEDVSSLPIAPTLAELDEDPSRALGWDWKLALLLMMHRWHSAALPPQQRGRWAPYLAVLPDAHTTPPFWTPSVMKLAVETTDMPRMLPKPLGVLLSAVRGAIDNVMRDVIRPHASQLFAGTSEEELERQLLWAHASVTTRVYGPAADGDHAQMLLPLADSMNHDEVRGTTHTGVLAEGGGSIVRYERTAQRAHAVGEEVYAVYARQLCNGVLVSQYGFAPSLLTRSGDCVTVGFNVSSLPAQMRDTLRGVMYGDELVTTVRAGRALPSDLLVAVRAVLRRQAAVAGNGRTATDCDVVQLLQSYVRHVRSGWKSTLKSDERRLSARSKRYPRSAAERAVLRVRVGNKRALEHMEREAARLADSRGCQPLAADASKQSKWRRTVKKAKAEDKAEDAAVVEEGKAEKSEL